MSTLRRRMLAAADNYEHITVQHPNLYYFECNITNSTKGVTFLNNGVVNKLIIDGVERSDLLNGTNNVQIPNGSHKVFLGSTQWNGVKIQAFCPGASGTISLIRLPRNSVELYGIINPASGGAIIECFTTTPRPLGATGTYLGRNQIKQIKIPKGTYNTYSTATNWSTYADKMVEVKYKIIEDE